MPATASSASTAVTTAQRAQYERDGLFILPAVIAADDLAVLRADCDRLVAERDGHHRRTGSGDKGLDRANSRYFINLTARTERSRDGFLFGALMADICRATLGGDAWLFYEQFVVKGQDKGMQFAWHQDSGYVGFPHLPYLTCWCALDDMSVANGTVYVLPYDRAGTHETQPHTWDDAEQALVGYRGGDPGDPIVVPAGSIAVFSSRVFHRSGMNTTPRRRRAYIVQYSAEPIIGPDDGKERGLTMPFLRSGRVDPGRLRG